MTTGTSRNTPLDAPLLQHYPAIQSRSAEEAEHLLRSIYGARRFGVVGDGSDFFIHANFKPVRDISLSFCSYGGGVEIEFPEADVVRQLFRINGGGRVGLGPNTPVMDVNCSLVLPAHVPINTHFSDGFQQLLVRIDEAALTRRLTALLGAEPKSSPYFYPEEPVGEQRRMLRRLVLTFADSIHVLEQFGPQSPSIAELEQLIVTTFLYANRNDYSEALHADPKDAAPWQVRAVEDYIASHWDKPMDMLQLVALTGASARSLYKTFARTRGYSPKTFLKQTRLKQARTMLQSGDRDGSVTAIALACGFNNLGHFAHDYRALFGELPSETLVKQRQLRARHNKT